ncbi:MAG: hypothetical protein KA391_02610 [Luteimonas sp.]|nr:hypothetical protein [Luteimonas sp.]
MLRISTVLSAGSLLLNAAGRASFGPACAAPADIAAAMMTPVIHLMASLPLSPSAFATKKKRHSGRPECRT